LTNLLGGRDRRLTNLLVVLLVHLLVPSSSAAASSFAPSSSSLAGCAALAVLTHEDGAAVQGGVVQALNGSRGLREGGREGCVSVLTVKEKRALVFVPSFPPSLPPSLTSSEELYSTMPQPLDRPEGSVSTSQ